MSATTKNYFSYYLLPAACAFCSGSAWQINSMARHDTLLADTFAAALIRLLAVGSAAVVLILICQWLTCRVIKAFAQGEQREAGWQRSDMLASLVLLLPLTGAFGFRFDATGLLIMLLVFSFCKLWAGWKYVQRETREHLVHQGLWLPLVFLLSGFAALIYQVVWQRYLLVLLGVNIESVTLVVSVFMAGLGLGALGGGALTLCYRDSRRLLTFFLGCELAIGLCGFASGFWFDWLEANAGWSGAAIKVAAMFYLSVPTLLMGATLPLLVAYLKQYHLDTGKAVGWLYCGSTLGSAIACFVTVHLLFIWLGLQGSLLVAVATNLIVIALALKAGRRFAVVLPPGGSNA